MPPSSSRLTEAHRLAQTRLGAATVADMLAAWRLVDPKALDATTPEWLRVAVRLIAGRRQESAELAAAYMRAFRLLKVGEALPPILMGALDVPTVVTSLTVTGPVSLKRATALARPLTVAAETAQANTARAAMRHALDGGRATISATIDADPVALGYRRVTSGKACGFCSLLAGRGAVYGRETSHFAAHDGCSCSSEPVYMDSTGDGRRVAEWTGRREDISPETRAANNERVRQFLAET